jgi:hypothetical protein
MRTSLTGFFTNSGSCGTTGAGIHTAFLVTKHPFKAFGDVFVAGFTGWHELRYYGFPSALA